MSGVWLKCCGQCVRGGREVEWWTLRLLDISPTTWTVRLRHFHNYYINKLSSKNRRTVSSSEYITRCTVYTCTAFPLSIFRNPKILSNVSQNPNIVLRVSLVTVTGAQSCRRQKASTQASARLFIVALLRYSSIHNL